MVGLGRRLLRRFLRPRLRGHRTEARGSGALRLHSLFGQAVASLAVDHFGWVGFDENPVTPGRLLGLGLVAAGVAAVRFL